MQVAFASVRDVFEGRSIGPAWVLFARGVCLRNSKGELVSDARGNDPNNLACTDATIWILAVDPDTAEPLVALTGFDESGTFAPTWRGSPASPSTQRGTAATPPATACRLPARAAGGTGPR